MLYKRRVRFRNSSQSKDLRITSNKKRKLRIDLYPPIYFDGDKEQTVLLRSVAPGRDNEMY